MSKDKRKYSSEIVDGVEQAPSRAMLRAVGFESEDFNKPQVGIASTWSMVTPCNMHINQLAESAASGADSAGSKSVIFNTITCLLYTSPSPRDLSTSRMPSSA